MKKDEKNGGIFEMDKEKALKNQGSEFREDIGNCGGRCGRVGGRKSGIFDIQGREKGV